MAARTARARRDLRPRTARRRRLGDVEARRPRAPVLRPGPRRRHRARRPAACSASTRPPTPRPPPPPHSRPGWRSPTVAESLRAIDRLSPWRMELHERADGLVVVNDAYNANPDSMRAALETLARMGQRAGRRTVAVLGEMRELGGELPRRSTARSGALAHELGHRPGRRGRRCRRPTAIHDALVDARGEDGTTRHVDTVERGRGVVARECGRVPTSCWSRRPGPGGSNASPTCSWATGGRRR